jgi:bile acid:Na+ symporter, BASS family
MKENKTIWKLILIVAAFLMMLATFFWITGKPQTAGPFLITGFMALAFGVRGFEAVKGFSYSLWIFTAVTVSMFYPQYFLSVGDFELKKLIVPLLQIIMFGMGSQMALSDLAGVIKMPKGVIAGIICQFTIMPVVGVTIAVTFGFPPEIAAGIVLVGTSPSGLASNVMSFLARANLALSVTLTAIATLLSPLLTPLLMKLLAGEMVEVNFWKMMTDIFNMVILPIAAGLTFNLFSSGKKTVRVIVLQIASYVLIILLNNMIVLFTAGISLQEMGISFVKNIFWFTLLPIFGAFLFRYFAKGNQEWLNKSLAFISMLGIAVIITIITAAGRDSLLDVGLLLILACFLHNMTGYGLGYTISKYILRMPERDCRTIALEVGMQNGGLASGLAMQMGKIATVGLAPAVFGPMMNITGSSLATWWRGKPPKDLNDD